jgi:mitogen-activated protein kinase 1/3
VEIKHIMLPPSPRDFKDIYVVFELMETDLHQVNMHQQRIREHGDVFSLEGKQCLRRRI